MKVKQTCTEKLRTFHHVKPHKSEYLDIDVANKICDVEYDPRPLNMRNVPGYYNYFRIQSSEVNNV
jgi:hypothetical protein